MAGGERIKTYLAKNLKEERSNSLSLSADMYYNFGNVQTNFLVEAFYTHLNNVFAQRVLKERDENGIRILDVQCPSGNGLGYECRRKGCVL